MQLDLDDEQTRALLNLITEAIEADRYPLSARIQVLREILVKFGEIGGPAAGPRAQAAPLCAAATGSPAA